MSWIERNEALDRLKVKSQTLYAYVSRGMVSARPHPDDPRASQYLLTDIDRLVKRRRSGRARESIAEEAISWGAPVMETKITTVRDGRLIYRGKDAVKLAEQASLEDIASRLWDCDALDTLSIKASEIPAGQTGKSRAFTCLARHAAEDFPSFGRPRNLLTREGAGLLYRFCSAVTGIPGRGLCHQRLARFWTLDPTGADLVRRALVLIADHELNPSTFAARVAAGTGASLSAAALSGLSTLSGPLHGEASARALAYLKSAAADGSNAALSAIISRQERLPATGHTLYPLGDPRAAALLEWMRPDNQIQEAITALEDASGAPANIDLALAALTRHLSLPDDAPFLLFATGRMVGWIAHAIEQSASVQLIRPRARYTGE